MVSYTLATLPPLTEEQEKSLQALVALPDREIDLSDIAETTEEQWRTARRGEFTVR